MLILLKVRSCHSSAQNPPITGVQWLPISSPYTGPSWLGSHTLIPSPPRHWPHSSHKAPFLFITCTSQAPTVWPTFTASGWTAHTGDPGAQFGTSSWSLFKVRLISEVFPEDASPCKSALPPASSLSFVTTSSITYSPVYLLMVYLHWSINIRREVLDPSQFVTAAQLQPQGYKQCLAYSRYTIKSCYAMERQRVS